MRVLPRSLVSRLAAAGSALATALPVALLSVSLVLTPILGHTPANAFDNNDERELGRKFNLVVRAQLPMVDDPEIVSYVQGLLDRLDANAPALPWPVDANVARQSALNAFAGPAGHMFVFTGLIANLEHESQVAAVLGHELGHLTQRHIAKKMDQSKYTGIASLLGVLAGAFLGGQGGQAVAMGTLAATQSAVLKYSREDETEADNVGLGYLVAAGYRPMAMVESFEVLRRKQFLGGGGNIPSYLSTHPALTERIGYLSDRIATMPAAVRERKDDDRAFKRIRTLILARYMDAELSLGTFPALPAGSTDPESCLKYLGRAIALDRGNRITEAGQNFDAALACAPNDPLMIREAGRHAFTQGDFNRAGSLFQKAIVLNPKDLISLFFYARILADGSQGQLDKAIEYMERVARSVPHDAEVQQYLGRMYGQSGMLFEAHMHLSNAALYSLDVRQARFHLEKAKAAVRSDAQRTQVEEQMVRIREIEHL